MKKIGTRAGTHNKIKSQNKPLLQQVRDLFQLTPAHQFKKRRLRTSFLFLILSLFYSIFISPKPDSRPPFECLSKSTFIVIAQILR